MTGIVDSHVHFWKRDRLDNPWLDDAPATLASDHLPADLLSGHDVIDALVIVEADCRADQALAEAEWFHELSDLGAPVLAVVAQTRLEADPREQLEALAALPLVTGVRRLLQGEPLGFALSHQFVSGIQLLETFSFSFDLCIRHEQLGEALELVRAAPGVRFALDHFGKPTPVPEEFAEWADALEALAAEPNVWAKLSGLATEAPAERRSFAALQPWLAHTLEVFGPERCMFGSDWPLVTTAVTYAEWVKIVQEAVPAEHRERVFSGTAREFYAPR